MNPNETVPNLLAERYASSAMNSIFSSQNRYSSWRLIWITLAECEKELGISITEEQIAQMKAKREEIDFARANEYEKKFRHDVMAHVHAFGDVAPAAKQAPTPQVVATLT